MRLRLVIEILTVKLRNLNTTMYTMAMESEDSEQVVGENDVQRTEEDLMHPQGQG